MDCRQLKLDCASESDGTWYVFCHNTGQIIVNNCRDCTEAWMRAAERFAEILSDIRRSATDLKG